MPSGNDRETLALLQGDGDKKSGINKEEDEVNVYSGQTGL